MFNVFYDRTFSLVTLFIQTRPLFYFFKIFFKKGTLIACKNKSFEHPL